MNLSLSQVVADPARGPERWRPRARAADIRLKLIELATSPEVQAEGIVKQFNWYPGIDAEHIQAAIDQATWDKLSPT